MTIESVMSIEEQIIRKMIEILAEHNWLLSDMFDSEEYHKGITVEEAIELFHGVDAYPTMFFHNDVKGTEFGVMLVDGNEFDVIADWTFSATDNSEDSFAKIMDKVCDWVNEQEANA